MKQILITTLLLMFALPLFAQKGSVTAVVVDAETKEGVAGAVAEITPMKYPEKKSYFTSGFNGILNLTGLAYGEYEVKISFIGYDSMVKTFTLSGAKMPLGQLLLNPSSTQIDSVVKEAKTMRTSQKGDTVSYNAGAFKVSTDADVEGLLKKMPGISVSDGAVQAQGEAVKKIFVDGKEFFGDDISTAIKSLPAEVVDRVEVYNKLSDNAEFSGMDDGEGYKALNIVTHKDMRQGQFGRITASYGRDFDTKTEAQNKYNIAGNANIFSGDTRVSLIGLFNNVNQQNFSFEDILGVTGGKMGRGARGYMTRPQSGVAKVNAVGLNYSDTWGKRDQVTFQGSYFFNGTNTTNRSTLAKWYEYPHIDTLTTTGYSETENFNNRLNARIEWKISKNQNLMVRPSVSFQSNDPLSNTTGWQMGQSGYSYTDTYNSSSRNGSNARLFAVYRAKLGKAGRTITVDGSGRYRDNQQSSQSSSNIFPISTIRPTIDPETGEFNPTGYTQMRHLYNNTPSNSYEFRGTFTYTEPVAKYAQVSMQYRASYEYQERTKASYITGAEFDPSGIAPDPALSNAYNSGYMIHRVGPGFRYAKEKNSLIFNVNYQRSMLDGRVETANSEKIAHSYNNFTYFVMGQFNINSANSIRLYVRSGTENPEVTDLQSVFDVSDGQYISSGNPNLNPSYRQSVMFNYTNSNIEKGRTFMWMFMLLNTSDYITSNVAYNGSVEVNGTTYNYLQYTRPINMNGFWQFSTQLSYGLPLSFMKCNFNLMGGVDYMLTPSQINAERNENSNMAYNLGAVLGSNISENIDFTFSWTGAYNVAKNTLVKSGNNKYFNHVASGAMKFVFWRGFTFSASASYTQYKGITNNYNDSYVLCNASIGKKLFRNQRGEISVGVNDLFNQNAAFVRTTGSGWTQNATNSVIGRYYMVTFSYNLRRFGKKGSKNIQDYKGVSDGNSSKRPMMPPHGAGGPPPRGFHGHGF
ncbi:MAG: outer membrane beta-barrel protein [Alistipes sp.]